MIMVCFLLMPTKPINFVSFHVHFNNFLSAGRDTVDNSTGKPASRQASLVESNPSAESNETLAFSQPLPQPMAAPSKQIMNLVKSREPIKCFSQPTHNEDLFLNSSQIQFTQSPVTEDNFQHLIKRMTRFFVSKTREEAAAVLCSVLDKQHYTWNIDAAGAVST